MAPFAVYANKGKLGILLKYCLLTFLMVCFVTFILHFTPVNALLISVGYVGSQNILPTKRYVI